MVDGRPQGSTPFELERDFLAGREVFQYCLAGFNVNEFVEHILAGFEGELLVLLQLELRVVPEIAEHRE